MAVAFSKYQKSYNVTFQIKAIEQYFQYFAVTLSIMMKKDVPTFKLMKKSQRAILVI